MVTVPGPRQHPADSFPLREIGTSLLTGHSGQRWQVREDEQWCHLTPPGYRSRVQGWKLHISATWLSAPMVLHQAARVLVEHGCAFKFAATLGRVRAITGKGTDRAQAGKFLTAYPHNDEQLRTLAPLLDRATAGLPGPVILSDRPVREGSLVHYRYGAFTGIAVLTNDGSWERRIETPDGEVVADPRKPWFCPPGWATLPFEGSPGQPSTAPARPAAVLLGGRFRVERAIRHSARGGVYRAIDQRTGEPVVVKQARAHIAGLGYTEDARDGLRHEAAMLAELGELGPRPVHLFAQGPHLFLAVEQLPGEPLAHWVRRWWEGPTAGLAPDAEGPPVAEALAMAARLADLVDAVHARGLVFRDLSPLNVMVLDDGSLRLIDAELAARPGDWVPPAHTPGFAAPEVLATAPVGPAPGPSADHYSLGALLCYLSTGWAPPLPQDTGAPARRSAHERITLLLRYAAVGNPAASRLAPAGRGLTDDSPDRRWDTTRLRELLAAPASATAGSRTESRGQLEPHLLQRLITDGVAHLTDALVTGAPEELFRGTSQASGDLCNVQHGAAGVLAVLVRASELLGDQSPGGEQRRAAVARTARWLDRRRANVSPLLPGLYFGRSGTAWALSAAARHLDDPGLADRALELAVALPVRWPNPDVTHGTAGAGLANLHLWYETKQPVFLERVGLAADHLLEQAQRTDDGQVYWRVDPDFDSSLAGATHYGFAHGVAGIGTFLLAAARATGRADCRELAAHAGYTLATAAIRSAGAAYWPDSLSGPSDRDLRYHWCSGASGVGTFLIRLWLATGEQRHRELAHEAAVTVHRGRWLSGVSSCHGLAGNGELLLDLAAAIDGPYRDWAGQLAACLYARHTVRGGRIVVYDESEARPSLDFGTGIAGVVGYALRLRYGGPRWWLVDTAGTDSR